MENWDYKEIRRRSWDTAFKKGLGSWWTLVIVGTVFSFIGAANANQTAGIRILDQFLGLESTVSVSNVEILKNHVLNLPVFARFPFLSTEPALNLIDALTKSYAWVIQLFGANAAYFNRNPGEVIWILIATALLSILLRFFVLNASLIGRERFLMENRMQKNVRIRRTLAPYHRKYLLRLVWVGFCRRITVFLWSMTVVGGVYKAYQYAMVPYLQAENPQITWREAKKLSADMTNGYKWNMFLTQLSYIYIFVLKLVPVLGLLIALPLEYQLNTEFYFVLRERSLEKRYFIEPAFDGLPYVEDNREGEPLYLLDDLVDDLVIDSEYGLTDLIAIFFTFCFAGWCWEVLLHLMQHHELVNRGTLYGPWLPIYGCGGVAIIFLLNRFKNNPTRLFLMTVGLCGVLEYAASLILDFIYNASYWDYKEMFLNLNGRICFAGLLLFGIGGMFGIYIAGPKIREMMRSLPRRKQILICAVLVALFAADLICVAIFGFNSGSGVGGSI
ncbi:MAG: hypothetical protein II016_04725 [Erysipelotrichaceae bacterium]|nr:hypothetical protein [Erysipelotrichaceae bacterium]